MTKDPRDFAVNLKDLGLQQSDCVAFLAMDIVWYGLQLANVELRGRER